MTIEEQSPNLQFNLQSPNPQICNETSSVSNPVAIRQEPPQELIGSLEGVEPPAVEQRVVDVVGKDDQLVIDVVRAQHLHEPVAWREVPAP
jgi:hypothetical protein